MFVNCGARVSGNRPKTKKALKEAMRDHPETVTFDATSLFDGGGSYRGDNIPAGVTLQVVGPDPYNKRNWYANVTSKKVS